MRKLRVGDCCLDKLQESHWVRLDRLKDGRVVVLESAHHTLIGVVVLAHLQEESLVVRVDDHRHDLAMHARRESKQVRAI